MKLSQIFSFFLVIFVASSAARRCAGRPRNSSCSGALDLGRRRRNCTPRTMWYYNALSRRCEEMRYTGCGGNNNRWCTKAACDQRCTR